MPAATEADAPVSSSSKPIQVTVPKREKKKSDATKEYWLGTLDDSPRQNYPLNAGGIPVEFVRYSGHYNCNEFGQIEGNPPRGSRRHLTDAQVESLKKDVLNFVVRKSARPKEGQPWESVVVGDVLDVRGADPKFCPKNEKGDPIYTYREPGPGQEPDEPLARYLYLYEVVPGVALPTNPEPMIARTEPAASA